MRPRRRSGLVGDTAGKIVCNQTGRVSATIRHMRLGVFVPDWLILIHAQPMQNACRTKPFRQAGFDAEAQASAHQLRDLHIDTQTLAGTPGIDAFQRRHIGVVATPSDQHMGDPH